MKMNWQDHITNALVWLISLPMRVIGASIVWVGWHWVLGPWCQFRMYYRAYRAIKGQPPSDKLEKIVNRIVREERTKFDRRFGTLFYWVAGCRWEDIDKL